MTLGGIQGQMTWCCIQIRMTWCCIQGSVICPQSAHQVSDLPGRGIHLRGCRIRARLFLEVLVRIGEHLLVHRLEELDPPGCSRLSRATSNDYKDTMSWYMLYIYTHILNSM
jgi:hypothetical protein